jgi:hypothetical protein
MILLLIIILLILYIYQTLSLSSLSTSQCYVRRNDISMKWMFSKGTGSLSDLGGIGSEGEYYYIPSKKPVLKAPASALLRDLLWSC